MEVLPATGHRRIVREHRVRIDARRHLRCRNSFGHWFPWPDVEIPGGSSVGESFRILPLIVVMDSRTLLHTQSGWKCLAKDLTGFVGFEHATVTNELNQMLTSVP